MMIIDGALRCRFSLKIQRVGQYAKLMRTDGLWEQSHESTAS